MLSQVYQAEFDFWQMEKFKYMTFYNYNIIGTELS